MSPVAGAVKRNPPGGTGGPDDRSPGLRDARRHDDAGSRDGAGLGARLESALSTVASVITELDPDRLTGADATVLYSSLVGLERLTNAGKTLLAPRIEASGIWRDQGHRSAAVMLASLEGVATGQAQATLSNGQRLGQLPGTEAALRTGCSRAPRSPS
jgi:hypothetical protein